MQSCPCCRKPVTVKDEVYCNNNKCLEFNVRYLPYEFKELITDLTELQLLEGAL